MEVLRVRNCQDCPKSKIKTCEGCEERISQLRGFRANLNTFKWKPPNEEIKKGPMLTYYVVYLHHNCFSCNFLLPTNFHLNADGHGANRWLWRPS